MTATETATKPPVPAHQIRLGMVVRDPNTGHNNEHTSIADRPKKRWRPPKLPPVPNDATKAADSPVTSPQNTESGGAPLLARHENCSNHPPLQRLKTLRSPSPLLSHSQLRFLNGFNG